MVQQIEDVLGRAEVGLPAVGRAVGREARSIFEGPRDHSPTILVVDDDQEVLEVMVLYLSQTGYRVLPARDGEEALRIFNAEHPELIITDLSMPGMNGLELIEAIKAISPRTEVLVLTGHSSVASAIDALRRGVFDYLQKPFELVRLLQSVERALERFRLVSEKEALLRELEERVRLRTQALVESQRQLCNAEKLAAVGQFAAGLAHELGNALAIIGGSVQFLLGYPGDRRQASREYLEVIHRNVAATNRTIREILAFARPTEPFLGPMDVTESLDRAHLLLKGEFAKHGVEVVQQYAPALPRIQGDSEQLQQVFLNLLLNAIQAMEDGGTITIRAIFDPPEWVRVELMDTGRGIPEEHLDRIFDPFFTTRERGTGLGLSIAHRHVEAHQGRLTVESQEGKGTRFSIFLPAMAPEQVLARAE
jgi:signal transduction histidine kinase